jgi:hypothetical protein
LDLYTVPVRKGGEYNNIGLEEEGGEAGCELRARL